MRTAVEDPRKIWKLSDMDLKSYSRWSDYSRARDNMLAMTDTAWAPWHIARTDDKKRGRLNIISHLLSQVPYVPPGPRQIALPKRQGPGKYREPDLASKYIPTLFSTKGSPSERSGRPSCMACAASTARWTFPWILSCPIRSMSPSASRMS